MKVGQGGFTIVEVLIVLAISGLMLVSAITVFSNSQRDTSFNQAVYDLQSELKSIANDVSSQSVPGLERYKCEPSSLGGSMRPTLSSDTPTGESCMYLGDAIQVITNGTHLYIYPVFGLRTVYSGSTDTGETPTTITDANPNPATDSSDNIITGLITDYPLLNGIKAVSSRVNGSEKDLVALYNNLSDSNTSGNEITAYTYDQAFSDIDDVSTTYGDVKNCIRTGCSLTELASNSWQLCVGDGTKQALVSVKGTSTTIVTTLNMNGCS